MLPAFSQLLNSLKARFYFSSVVQPRSNTFTTDVNVKKLSPLKGIRVLDLTRIVAGPYCTMLLGDLGADIIKIEQPEIGDEARRWGPHLDKVNLSSYFVSLNRNKKSVCVDLKIESGKTIIKELAKKCDVLVENFVPGKLESLGLGFDDLNKIAPQLIYCSITGYGPKGPYRLRPGVDVIAAAYAGLLHVTGPKDGEPCRVGIPMTDICTGIYAYGAIMTALFQREKTGVGQKIDCNLISTQLSCMINIASSYLNANQKIRRSGSSHPSIVPYQVFPTANSFITICAFNNDQFTSLCRAVELDYLLKDDKFATNSLRVKNRETLVRILKEKLITKTTKEWLTVLEGSSFPYAPVNSMSKVFEDEHIKEIGIVKEMQMEYSEGNETKGNMPKIKFIGPAIEFGDCENSVRFPPPVLGQHTADVLKSILGYSDDQLEILMKNGSIS